jgi:hypothetical protein
VFTARYALSPYIKQICFVFKGLNKGFAVSVKAQWLYYGYKWSNTCVIMACNHCCQYWIFEKWGTSFSVPLAVHVWTNIKPTSDRHWIASCPFLHAAVTFVSIRSHLPFLTTTDMCMTNTGPEGKSRGFLYFSWHAFVTVHFFSQHNIMLQPIATKAVNGCYYTKQSLLCGEYVAILRYSLWGLWKWFVLTTTCRLQHCRGIGNESIVTVSTKKSPRSQIIQI